MFNEIHKNLGTVIVNKPFYLQWIYVGKNIPNEKNIVKFRTHMGIESFFVVYVSVYHRLRKVF